jgi:hypothetical protein
VKRIYFETFPICQPGFIDTYGALVAAIFLPKGKKLNDADDLVRGPGEDVS